MGEKKKAKQPDWLLTEEWGISRDTYNWTLVYRPHDAKSDKWHAKGYFGSIEQLVAALHYHLGRTIEAEPELMDHITKCSRDVSEAATRLAERIEPNRKIDDLRFIIEAKKTVIEDGRRLTRELDKACFGKDAAEQASLADLVKVIPEEMNRLRDEVRQLKEANNEV